MEKKHPFSTQAFGQAVKNARKSRGLTRNQVSEMLNITPRYLMSIENNGQIPSLQVFYDLVTSFDLSVDKLFFGDAKLIQSTRRKQLDTLLGQLREDELIVLEGAVQGLLRARKAQEQRAQHRSLAESEG